MYAQMKKPKENKSRAVAQKESTVKQGFGFVDNRREAVVQRKIKEMIQKKTDGEDLKVKYDDSRNLQGWEGTKQNGNDIHFLSRHGPANSSEGHLRGRIIAQIDMF